MTMRPRPRLRRIQLAIRHCVSAAVVLLACSPAAQATDTQEQELDCLVEPSLVVNIGSVRGIVDSVAVDRSDTVRKNEVLVRLDAAEQAATVRQARVRANMTGELKAREAALAFAQRKLDRISELYSSEAIAALQRDEAQTELELATQQLRQAQETRDLARHDLERAKVELARRTIRSPMDGIVVERFVGPGEFVNDTPLLRVAQMDPLRVETIAPSSMFGSVRPGMKAKINASPQGSGELTATVTIVDRMIDPASDTFGIRLELPNPDYAIPSGLNCRLSLEPISADNDVEKRVEPSAPTLAQDGLSSGPASRPTVLPNEWSVAERPSPADTRPVSVSVEGRIQKRMAARTAPRVSAKAAAVPAAGLSSRKQDAAAGSLSLAVPTDRSCVTLGPIDDESLLRKLQLALSKEPVAVTARNDEDAEEVIGYFVLTPRAATLEDARATGAQLRRRGVADLAILTRPPYDQRVSLGLYSSLQGARAREAQLAEMDPPVKTQVLPRTRPVSTHWLDVAADAAVLETRPWSALAPKLNEATCDSTRYVADAKASTR